MNDDVDWTLLAKYLFGECTEGEEESVHAWMERDPKRIALMRQLRRALQNQEDPVSSKGWNTDALWERVREQTEPEESGADVSSSPSLPSRSAPREESRRETRSRDRRRRRKSSRVSSKHVVWGGAMALLLAITFVGTLWQRGTPDLGARTASVQEADTFTTQKSERARVRLTDGTRVHLNVDTRLTVPPDFGDETRRVKLEGEAFFEVVDDSTRPFIVESKEVVTHVLGTAFDVNAYPDEEEAKVVVSEGRVSLQAVSERASSDPPNPQTDAESGREETSVVLTKHDIARVTQSGNQIIRQEKGASEHLAWMDGELILKQASFETVVQKLERWYDLQISVDDGMAVPPGHLNSRFAEDQPLNEVLSVVATAFGLEYERHQKHVTFSSTGESHLQ